MADPPTFRSQTFEVRFLGEEGFVGATCHQCAWQPEGYADRHKVKKHIAETGHNVTLRKTLEKTWGGKTKQPSPFTPEAFGL